MFCFDLKQCIIGRNCFFVFLTKIFNLTEDIGNQKPVFTDFCKFTGVCKYRPVFYRPVNADPYYQLQSFSY